MTQRAVFAAAILLGMLTLRVDAAGLLVQAPTAIVAINLFGSDDRRPVETGSSEDAALSAVGVLARDGRAEATGFLLGARDVVVTTAHSFYDHGRFKSGRYAFLPAGEAVEAVDIARSDIVAVGTRYPRREPWRDWAIVRLPAPVAARFRPLVHQLLANNLIATGERSVELVAYHRDRIEADHWPIRYVSEPCTLRIKAPGDHFADIADIDLHDCDFDVISSGGPLLVRHGDDYAVIGINAGFFTPYPHSKPARLLAFGQFDGRLNPHYAVRFGAGLTDALERVLGGRLL